MRLFGLLGAVTAVVAEGVTSQVELVDLTSNQVQTLLKSWNLDGSLSNIFSKYQVDGVSLSLIDLNSPECADGTWIVAADADQRPPPVVWRKLCAMLQAASKNGVDPSVLEKDVMDSRKSTVDAKRKLTDTGLASYVDDADDYSSLFIKRDKAAVQMGADGDVTLARSELAELLVIAQTTKFHGDVAFEGSLSLPGIADTGALLDELVANVSALSACCSSGGMSSSSSEGTVDTTIEDNLIIDTTTYSNGTVVTTVTVNPEETGGCPGDLALYTEEDFSYGRDLFACHRDMDEAGYRAFYYEVEHDVGTIDIDLVYHQYYSADAFASASGTTVEDDVFCEGVTIASIDSLGRRQHIYTAAVGYTYDDDSYTSYNCGPRNCEADSCNGPSAPLWMGDAFTCNSGSIGGTPSSIWYGGMDASFTAGVRLQAGDVIEVRVMADQETSNEDLGISSLIMNLNPTNGYPYGGYNDLEGWVEFEAPTEDRTVMGIDASISGSCPGSFEITYGYEDTPTCHRNLDDAGTVSSSFAVSHDVGSVTLDMTYNQYYSADAFASAGDSTIDDEYFMEGITIASINSAGDRTHIYSYAVGIAYDTSYTDYNCPLIGCDYPDTAYCVGPYALPWMGDNVYCSSKNSGDWEAVWYDFMGPEDAVTVGTVITSGDEIEVRAMADQGTDNEDVGIASLKIILEAAQTYPFGDGNGWVIYEEPSDTRTVIGIDPSINGVCPGELQIDHGYEGGAVCTRNMDTAGNRAASFEMTHDASSVTIDLTYLQHYSADAFNSASGASIDDDYYMEGIAIAKMGADGARTHIFSASVGIAYDTSYTSYNCPSDNCGYDDQSMCVGPSPPDFAGNDFWCDSGNSGDWEQTWYAPMETPTWTVDIDIVAGEYIEVRAMADQETSNEDVGIASLVMSFE